jgi:AraC family transcriptional regulator
MPSQELANTYDEVRRLLNGEAPPLIPDVLSGDTRLTGEWINPPFDGFVPPLEEHCLVRHVAGSSHDGDHGTPCFPGTVSLIPRGEGKLRRSIAPMRTSNVFLTARRLQSCADLAAHGERPELLERNGFTDVTLFRIMSLLSDEATSHEPTSRLFMEQLIDVLCLHLLRLHALTLAPGEVRARRGLAPWQVKRVTAYMRDNLAFDIGLQELADVAGLSRFYFCHAFRLATGYTPHQWLTKLRMDQARWLLTEPRAPISDIALSVGYRTPSAFSAAFRRFVGSTPREFRRRL